MFIKLMCYLKPSPLPTMSSGQPFAVAPVRGGAVSSDKRSKRWKMPRKAVHPRMRQQQRRRVVSQRWNCLCPSPFISVRCSETLRANIGNFGNLKCPCNSATASKWVSRNLTNCSSRIQEWLPELIYSCKVVKLSKRAHFPQVLLGKFPFLSPPSFPWACCSFYLLVRAFFEVRRVFASFAGLTAF